MNNQNTNTTNPASDYPVAFGLLIDNFNTLHKLHPQKSAKLKHIGSLGAAQRGIRIDAESVKSAQKLLKENATGFPSLQDGNLFMTSIFLSFDTNPPQKLQEAIDLYNHFCQCGLKKGAFLTTATLAIVFKQGRSNNTGVVIDRTMRIFKSMKKTTDF